MTITTVILMTDSHLSLLKLLQLSSPTLPVGAFAYSQGLESAIDSGIIKDSKALRVWLTDSLELSLKHVDLPIFFRLYHAWQNEDLNVVMQWNQILRAQRETNELRSEDHHLGLALARLLKDLDVTEAKALHKRNDLCFITLFTLAANKWNIDIQQAANGFVWSWLDNQIAAAIKLVPLGQTDGQKVLSDLLPKIPNIVEQSTLIEDDDIGASLPMMAILSAQHETQYSRLFRS
ncbi:urease accessory protein UreF [Cocleimonas flava]|nr:urease accessory UreF family protein [Cocleimonas flava]